MPKTSVIIPSFNCARYLSGAIDSILAQTTNDYEVIVVDDGSTDLTREVVMRYAGDARIRYLYQANLGLPGARNTGIRSSQATYVAFLDADDALAPEALAVLSEALEHSQASWCVTDIVKVSGDHRTIRRSNVPGDHLLHSILRDDFICRGMFFKRRELIAAGMYDEDMKNREDWDLNIRMLERGEAFVYLPRPLYLYSWREGSITTGNSAKMLYYTEQILRKHHKRLADAGDPEAAKLYAENMWGLARNHCYLTRNFRKALQCVCQSLAYDPSPRRLVHPVVHRLQRLTAN